MNIAVNAAELNTAVPVGRKVAQRRVSPAEVDLVQLGINYARTVAARNAAVEADPCPNCSTTRSLVAKAERTADGFLRLAAKTPAHTEMQLSAKARLAKAAIVDNEANAIETTPLPALLRSLADDVKAYFDARLTEQWNDARRTKAAS